jgi:hypothetical protein
MAEVPTLSAMRPSGFKPEAAARQLRHPCAEDGGPDPLRLPAHPISNRGTASMTVSSSMAEDGVLETHSQGATRFPDDDPTLAASSSTAESGRLERHGRSRALVSSEARSLIGSLSMITSYRSADSNREPPGSGPGASTELG